MKTRLFVAFALVAVLSLTMMATASAALPTGMSWVKDAGNPVAPAGLCGVAAPSDPAVVVESTDNYKMYFTTHPGTNGAQIYLATTTDGGQSWTCENGGSPVLPVGASGAWDAVRVVNPAVIKDGSDYKMWYTGRDAAGHNQIGYATSSDGVAWTKYGSNPVLPVGLGTAWDSQLVRDPAVVKDGSGTYHMWYSGTANWPYFAIGHATSSDGGVTWTKDASNPVLTPTSGSWDAIETYAPSVVMNGSAFEMFYSGNAGNRWLTGHATSDNGTAWTKDANAFLSPSVTGWDNGDSTDYVAGVLDGSTWKVFYSGAGASSNYQIGMTTLSGTPQLTFAPLMTSVAVGNTAVVTIDLSSVTNLYGYQFQVTYDASKVTATGVFVNSFFDTSGQFVPGGWDGACAAGVCKFAVSKQGATAVSGSDPLAQITFTGFAPGLVALNFSDDILADRDGNQLTHTSDTGWLQVYGTTTLSGVVQLQGRDAAHSDAGTVTIYEENGLYPTQAVPFSASTGVWTATVPTGGTYDLLAAHSLYLSNRLDAVTSGVQATTVLKGGDATNNGTIDINDLSCIGGDFGKTALSFGNCGGQGSPDINADNTINILDLVLAGGNFELTSPQPWTTP